MNALELKTLGLFARIPFNSTPEYTQAHLENAQESAIATKAYMTWIGLNREVIGHVFEGDNESAPNEPSKYNPMGDGYGKFAIRALKKTFNIACDYHMMMVQDRSSMCGRAECPGRWGVRFNDQLHSPCGDQTVFHEHLHQCGENHSGTYSDGFYRYYGDGSCKLGGHNFVMPNAAHMFRMGLLSIREALELSGSGTHLLMPLELRARDLFPNAYRTIRIGDYFLSIRKCVGLPTFQQHPSRLYTHEINVMMQGKEVIDKRVNPTKNFTYRHRDLFPGESMTLPTGEVIEYLDYEDEVAEVRIKK